MNSIQVVHGGNTVALLQSSAYSLHGTRGIRGGRSLYRNKLSIPGCCNRKPYLFEFPTPGSVDLGQLGFSRSRSWTRFTGRVRSSRKDSGNISSLERLVRRTVKSEEEQKQKEEGIKEEQPKSVAVAPTHTKLEALVTRARSVLMTARIFTSMMTWVVLFFMASIWDGDSQGFKDKGGKNGKRGPRRYDMGDGIRQTRFAGSKRTIIVYFYSGTHHHVS